MEQAAELEKVRGPVLALLDALERGQLIMLNAGGLVLELGRSHPLTPLLAPAAMVLDADDVAALAALKEAGDA